MLVVLMAALLAACGTPSDATPGPASVSPGASSPTVSATGSPPTPSASATQTAPATATTTPIATDPPPVALEAIAAGLSAPISIAAVPDGRLLVNERGGRVVVVDPSDGATSTALDIGDRVLGQGEQGLLGLALDPAWPDDTSVYVHYTDGRGRTVLSEFTMTSTESLEIDPGSETVLIQLDQPFANHNGGQLAFGPDGHLYVGLGDGGAGGDPMGNGQNPETLLGSILRLDVGAGDGEPYAVPDDNPFVDGGGAPEVFLHGLRNPWRFSFDRVTGELWVADVGQNAFEEVDRVDPASDAGGNLGWNVMEASHCYGDADCSDDGLIGPVTEYGRDVGCSITGGYVYRGTAVPGLAGWYLFSDYCSGILMGIPSDVESLTPPRTLAQMGISPSAFGEDAAGELYVADIEGGTIYRIVPGG